MDCCRSARGRPCSPRTCRANRRRRRDGPRRRCACCCTPPPRAPRPGARSLSSLPPSKRWDRALRTSGDLKLPRSVARCTRPGPCAATPLERWSELGHPRERGQGYSWGSTYSGGAPPTEDARASDRPRSLVRRPGGPDMSRNTPSPSIAVSSRSTLIRSLLAGLALCAATASAARGQIKLMTVFGDANTDNLGTDARVIGDVDGDGVPDFVAGAPGHDIGAQAFGEAIVFSGSDGSVLFRFYGTVVNDELGGRVGRAGDVDADGYPDVIVGSTFIEPG